MLHINSKLYLKTTGMNSFSFPLNSAILKSSQTMKKNYGGGGPKSISHIEDWTLVLLLSLCSHDYNDFKATCMHPPVVEKAIQ